MFMTHKGSSKSSAVRVDPQKRHAALLGLVRKQVKTLTAPLVHIIHRFEDFYYNFYFHY